jgi:uncharacterized protein (TIGR02145 family)
MNIMRQLGIILLIIAPFIFKAQNVSNIQFKSAGNMLEVYYDLNASAASSFTIELYVSVNEGQTWEGPLKQVSGDVGEKQKAGRLKMIKWDVLNEFGDLSGDVKFKVKALKSNLGVFTDPRDGKEYEWVKIGNQKWMTGNLDYNASGKKYPGLAISADVKLGRLYTWDEAITVCPDGWHLPGNDEWTELLNQFGGEKKAGGKLKSSAIWNGDYFKGTNESRFSAIPAGYRKTNGDFTAYGNIASWWSSSEYMENKAWSRSIGYDPDEVLRSYDDKTKGLSVRCVKDN